MSIQHIYRLGLSLFAWLIISLQTSAISHAAQYGDDPHEHDGIVCVVDAIAQDSDVVLPPLTAFDLPSAPLVPSFETVFTTAAYVTPPGRAPPPRSPPYILF